MDLREEREKLLLSRKQFADQTEITGRRIGLETIRHAEDGESISSLSAQAILQTLSRLAKRAFTPADFPHLRIFGKGGGGASDDTEPERAIA